METRVRTAILVSAAYIAAQMMADVMALKLVIAGAFAMSGGTLIYPVTFTLRDLLHKTAGRSVARMTILAAGIINMAMAALFWLLALLPPNAPWDAVLAPVWRIVAASIVAEVLSEMLDTEVYHLWITRITRRYQWLRVLTSNAISVPVDSLIFCWLAFGGAMPIDVVWSLVASQVVIKYVFTLMSLPSIYVVREARTEPTR